MRDSIDPFAIPLTNLAAVAGYGDGTFMWSSAGWARFPPSVVRLSIVVSAADQGDILDVEIGDASPADCPGWADRFDRPNRRLPTIYSNLNTIGAVRGAMGSRPFDWWAATLDGNQNVPGAVAVQYADANITGGNFDESVIVDPGWIGLSVPGDVLMLSDGLKLGLAHVAIKAIYQREPTQQELFDFANSLNADGSNYNDLVQNLADSLGNADLVRIQSETLAGEIDRLKTSGFVQHTHAVTAITGTGITDTGKPV
jgi:hypothetical protein